MGKIPFNFTAADSGNKKISATALADTLTSYSSSILVNEQEKAWWELIIDAIIGFFEGIANAIAGLAG